MKMLEISMDERPREKLALRGAEALSNSELLAVILRSGSREENVMEMARHLLADAGGSLTGLFAMTSDRMSDIKGLGKCKAASVLAALELGKRFFREEAPSARTPITSPSLVYRTVLPFLKGLTHEECWVLYLNTSNLLVGRARISTGASDQTTMDIKQTVRLALDKKAAGMVLVHNHPSGNPHPSEADLRFTEELHNAAALFDICLLDHIIVCNDCYYCFSEEKICKK